MLYVSGVSIHRFLCKTVISPSLSQLLHHRVHCGSTCWPAEIFISRASMESTPMIKIRQASSLVFQNPGRVGKSRNNASGAEVAGAPISSHGGHIIDRFSRGVSLDNLQSHIQCGWRDFEELPLSLDQKERLFNPFRHICPFIFPLLLPTANNGHLVARMWYTHGGQYSPSASRFPELSYVLHLFGDSRAALFDDIIASPGSIRRVGRSLIRSGSGKRSGGLALPRTRTTLMRYSQVSSSHVCVVIRELSIRLPRPRLEPWNHGPTYLISVSLLDGFNVSNKKNPRYEARIGRRQTWNRLFYGCDDPVDAGKSSVF
jgi:hypothetical protein